MTKTSLTITALILLVLVSCQSQVPSHVEIEPTAAQDATVPGEVLTPTSTGTGNQTAEATPDESLHLELVDSSWDGERIPDGQQCQRQGGENPSTPSIRVGNLPDGTEVILLEFSDRDFGPMDNGGHGKVGYVITEGISEAVIPPLPGHTFDLPENYFLVQEHLAPGFDTPGAYMPPCSGGAGNSYYVTVKAVELVSMEELSFNVLGQGILELGEY